MEQITRDKLSGFIGALVFILNANILYMQTTAMFEPLLIATSMGIYYLIKWSQEQKLSQLLFGAFFIFYQVLLVMMVGFYFYVRYLWYF